MIPMNPIVYDQLKRNGYPFLWMFYRFSEVRY